MGKITRWERVFQWKTRWTIVLALGGVALGAVAVIAVLLGKGDSDGRGIGGAAGLLAGSVIAAGYYAKRAKRASGFLERMRSGQNVVHWHEYTAAELEAFAESERARRSPKEGRILRVTLIVIFGFTGLMIGIGAAVARVQFSIPKGVIFAGCLASGLLVGSVLGRLILAAQRARQERWLREMIERGADAYIGPDAIWFNGRYLSFRDDGHRLENVQVRGSDVRVLFVQVSRLISNLDAAGNDYTRKFEQRIPIPSDRLEEAEKVAASIRRLNPAPDKPPDKKPRRRRRKT